MNFTNEDLQKEYERLIEKYPDGDAFQAPLINVSDVFKAYFALADYFMDPDSDQQETMLVGLRSFDLLCSALGRQTVSYGNKINYKRPIEICSTLFFGLVKDHAFLDGNKRTALLTLLYQLWLYKYYPNVKVREFERLVVAVAANTLEQEFPNHWDRSNKEDREIKTIASFLRKSVVKKDHSYHITITMRTFVDALTKNGIDYDLDNAKIHFTRTIKHKWHQPRTLRFATVFGGWTRQVGPTTAREILTNLELYDQFPSYKSFINGEEAFYSYIAEFETPLRNLKDE